MSEEHYNNILGSIVKVDLNRCNGCMKCIKACTVNVFEKFKDPKSEKDRWVVEPVNEKDCFFCLLCELACPVNAIEVKRFYSSEDTLKSLLDSE